MTLLYCWWLTSMVAADWTSEVGGLALSQVELDAEAEAALVDCPRSTAAFVSGKQVEREHILDNVLQKLDSWNAFIRAIPTLF